MPENPPSLIPSNPLHSIPLLSNGVRPFFLAACIWAAAAMALWIASLTGHVQLDPRYGVVAWHAHEFLFGYVGAVLAGFLLTAGPNWTGRPPLTGAPLLGLFSLWLAGRLALLAYARLGPLALAIDSSLLIVVALWFAREIIAAKSWLNLRVVALITALAAANVLFHWEVVRTGAPNVSVRVALALIVSLIMVIGGRITPTFTRNWLIARKRPPYPTLFDRIDAGAIAIGVAGLVSWAAMPMHALSGSLLLAGGAAQFVRLVRWRGAVTYSEPLILILHLGYAFVPLGFLAAGLSVLRPDLLPATAALHAWTAGAIGVTTLGVMTRVALNETGRPPRAPPGTSLIYTAALLAALLRIAAPLSSLTLALLEASAVAWILAFAGFVVVYGPFLIRESAD
jgi:uncharacterized protein involved in response to NO